MNILYLSAVAAKAAIKEARRFSPDFSSYAVQKFNRLIVEGLARNGHEVTALSTFYLPSSRFFFRRHDESDNSVHYRYVSSPHYGILRHVWLIIYSFIYVFLWGVCRNKEKVLIADVLNISACIGSVAAARLIGLTCVGIMTDMPGMIVNRSNKKYSKMRNAFNSKLNLGIIGCFSHYVFLTKQMNNVINVKNKPYIVMEGLVDADLKKDVYVEKDRKRIVIYAGGLHERYGLKLLVEGFIKANVDNTELWIYGSGPFVGMLEEYQKQYPNVKYKGIRSNDEVVEAEMRATLLVNPRPTHEEFTKYSFPSKNIEYMVSGTPLLTTILPGIPREYMPFLYLFDKGENAEGYSAVLREILLKPEDELRQKGQKARFWVLQNKNNIIQTSRIVDLVHV